MSDRVGHELLNRSEVVPLYYQLVEVLESRIVSGAWPAHQRLASERELCDEFSVSRAVVRAALEILEREGRIRRVQGKGTFIAPPKSVMPIRGIVATFAAPIGRDTEVTILDAGERAVDAQLAGVLNVDQGRPVLHVAAKVSTDGRPRYLVNSTIALHRVAWLEAVLRPDARLSGCGPFGSVALGPAHVQIESGSFPDFEAEQLDLSPGSQVLVARLLQYATHDGDDQTPLESTWLIYAADSVCLDGDLTPATEM